MQGHANYKRGFSGAEILMIILALMILVGILVYGSGFIQKKVRDSQREQIMKGIMVALEGYKAQYNKYPSGGTPIVGGGVVAGAGDFNSMAAALGQGDFMDAKAVVDPAYGPLFGAFNGTNRYQDGAKFSSKNAICQNNGVKAQVVDIGGVVSYSYYSKDGESFVMCLVNEEGEELSFKSPAIEFDNL